MNKKFNRTHQTPMAYIFTGENDQALATGALANGSNAVGIANGQFGILSTDFTGTTAANNFKAAADDAQDVKSIKVLRGTPNSANLRNVSPFKLNDQAYLSTVDIMGHELVDVFTTLPEIASYSMKLMTGFTAPAVGTTYNLVVELESITRDVEWADERRDIEYYPITTEAVAPTAPTDWLLQNLALKANGRSIWREASGKPFIVFGVDIAGAAGTVVGTIVAGDSIPFMNADGLQSNFIADTAFVKSLQEAIAAGDLAGTERIVNLDPTTAGTANTVDALLLVGLDEIPAVIFDEETRNKVQIEAGLDLEHTTDTQIAEGKDWIGTGKQWFLEWKRFYGKQHYFENWLSHPYGGSVETVPSYITNDVDTLYTSTIITFNKTEMPTSNYSQTLPHKLIILLPAVIDNPGADASTPYTVSTTDTATVAALNASLGVWLASGNAGHTYQGDATEAAPFV